VLTSVYFVFNYDQQGKEITTKATMSSTAPALDNGLPLINRFITDHDAEGKAVFTKRVQEELQWQELPDGARFCLGYTTNHFPVKMNEEQDVSDYLKYLENKPGIMIPGGTVLRIVDMRPGATSPMHRTVSLDYGVVLEGEVELVLDSGEVRLMKRGDIAVQRGTNHAWRNASPTAWARMLYVLQESEALKIGDKKLEEDYGGIPGVRPSGH
jgi:quercetin dioxygenase-like cupin family protein